MTKLLSRTKVIIMLALILITACTKTPKSNPATNDKAASTVSPAEKQLIEKEITALSKTFFKHL